MRRLSGILVGGLLVTMTAGPALAQADAWQRKWYWGAQSGAFFYSTPTVSNQTAFTFGGHWLITSRRSALYLAIDQIFFPNGATSQVSDGTAPGGVRTVTFDSGRRLQAGLVAIPSDKKLQVFLGGGIAIHQITDATAQGSTDLALVQRVEEAATRAFAFGVAGVQLRFSRRWALFGSYHYMPSSNNFLITSAQHALTAGLRIAISSSHEAVTTQR